MIRSSWLRWLFARSVTRTASPQRSSFRPGLVELEGRIVPAFQPVQGLAVGAAPSAVAVADVNGDGKPDLISANRDANSVSILLAGNNGAFGAARNFAAGLQPEAVTAADVNRDGKLDLLTANAGTNTVSVLLGSGDGNFGTPRDFATGAQPKSLAAADLNRDGTPDLVVANQGSNTISILPGNGDGTFAATQSIAVGAQPAGVAVGDVNRDGKLDLVVTNQSSNTVSVLLGNGAGSFTAPQTSTTETGPRAVTLADLNRDGILDLVTASTSGNSVTALRGKGDGTFDMPNTYATGASPVAVVAADLNADGKLDLATANQSGNTVSVLVGQGNGTFLAGRNLNVGTAPSAIVAADADGDGSLDLVAASRGTNQIGVLINDAAPADSGTYGALLLTDDVPRPDGIAVGDVNLDGKPDLLVTSYFWGTAGLMIGNGDGTFTSAGGNFIGFGPQAEAIADVNGDGRPDVLVADQDGYLNVSLGATLEIEDLLYFETGWIDWSTLTVGDVNRDGKVDAVLDGRTVLLGNGDGTFGAPQTFDPSWQQPPSPPAPDVNNDGVADLISSVPDDDPAFGFVTVRLGQRNSATRLELQPPLSAVAGVPVTFPVVALADGGTDGLYTGTVRFTSSDPLAVLPADATFSLADMGSRSFSITLNTAGTQTVTAVDTATGAIRGQFTVTVSPVGSSALVVSDFASPTTSGTPDTFTVKAVDPRTGAVMTGYRGTLRFTSSDPQAVLPAEYTFTAADAGVHNFTATLKTAGVQSLVATDRTTNFTASQSGIQVTAAAAVGFRVTPAASPVTAGTAASFTVTALDAAGNLASGYSGTVQFTSSDPQAVLPAGAVLSNGTGTFIATFKTAGSQSMTITDPTNGIDFTQTGIQVVAGRAVSFALNGLPSSATVGETRTFVLTARDAFGNVATGYTGRVVAVLTPDPEGWVEPALHDFTAADAGVHAFTAHFMTAGAQSVSVSDFGNQIFVSQGLQVNPPPATLTWANPASVVYGTPLGATQFNATANVPGTFVYSPAAGTVLPAGKHLLSVTFNPTDTTRHASTSTSVMFDVLKATPMIAWSPPAPILYGTALSATQLNATADVAGTFTYTQPAGTVLGAGSHTLSVTFTPTDTANYTSATASVTLTVNRATPVVTWSNPAGIVYGTPLSASQLNATTDVPGTFEYSPAAGTVLGAGTHTLAVTFTPDDIANYQAVTRDVAIIVDKASPTLNWAVPAGIAYGTALSAAQLNASADVPGTFTYSPGTGAVLAAGSHTLSVTFTPDDTANYESASADVTLIVDKATPRLAWANPASIVYGTALSATQLNATAEVPGTFTYTSAAGTVLGAGTHTLSVSFTPTDTANYNPATASATLTVDPATPTVTLSGGPFTYDNTPHVATATAKGVDGGVVSGRFTFTYNGSTTAPTNAGTYTVQATFSSDDPNYATATGMGTLLINPATPVVTWSNPTDVVYGTPLSDAQLNATADVPGTFAYSPAAGTVLGAGTHTLAVTFTPDDTANYTSITRSVTLSVDRAAPAITWVNPGSVSYGTPLSGAQLNATAAVPGTFVYTSAAGTVLDAGTHTLFVSFIPADTANYRPASASVLITVDRLLPVLQTVVVNHGQRQRSQVTSLTVVFSAPVFFTGRVFRLRDGRGRLIPLRVRVRSLPSGQTVVELRFRTSNLNPRALADGKYVLRIDCRRVMDAFGSGPLGGVRRVRFSRVYGDLNGTNRLEDHDLARFQAFMGGLRGTEKLRPFLTPSTPDDLRQLAAALGLRFPE